MPSAPTSASMLPPHRLSTRTRAPIAGVTGDGPFTIRTSMSTMPVPASNVPQPASGSSGPASCGGT